MKPAMTKAEFEALSARLLGTLPGINDARSLLAAVRRLLDAQLAVLLRFDASSAGTRRIIAAVPSGDLEWASRNLGALRSWFTSQNPTATASGFSKESTLEVEGRKFSDALIAFGLRGAPESRCEYELLVFHGDCSFLYNSYHCSAAAVLLRSFEHLEATRQRERARRERYSRALTESVLPDEPWEDLVDRISERAQPLEPAFIGPLIMQWTAYRCRPVRAFTSNPATACEWLKTSSSTDGFEKYLIAIEYLLGRQELSSELVKVLFRLAKEGDEPRKAVTMVAEIAWRRIAAEAEGASRPGLPASDTGFADLLNLTSTLAADALIASEDTAVDNSRRGAELGRATLRIYFGHLIAEASNLRKMYLRLDGGYEHRLVPNSVRSEYIRNLARYFLGMLEIIERRWGINVDSGLVSQLEFLDGLLYLIDRFVHVELEVEECLHVREHLAQGFISEVQHHLLRPFYRDHLVHVVDVFLLGHLLLNTRLKWIKGEERKLVEHLARLESAKDGPIQPEDWIRQWAVASLLHDIGYQLGRGPRTDKADEPFRLFFAGLGSSLLPGPEFETKSAFVERLRETLTGENTETWWFPMGPIDPMDHGVLSALRVAQLLEDAGQAQCEGVAQQARSLTKHYSHSLHAMANHNLHGKSVQLSDQPLACLLRICDELQEWGRPRVSIEKVVKHLYLTLEGGNGGRLDTREILQRVEGNLRFKCLKGRPGAGLDISVTGNEPKFLFSLVYNNAIETNFDVTTTFLSKAFNLQYVGLGKEEPWRLECRIELIFPRPPEYRGLSEYDIYGLYALRSRELPELLTYQSLAEAIPGLCRIESKETEPEDRIAIVVMGVTGEGKRLGWQRVNPDKIRAKFLQFKKEILTGAGTQRGKS